GWVSVVGTRTDSSGNASLFRARYFLDNFQFDTDFPNPGTDSVPNPFDFGAATGLDPAVTIASGAARITGLDVASPVSVDNGEYSIGCDGNFTSTPGTINEAQTVCVRGVSATTPNTIVAVTL